VTVANKLIVVTGASSGIGASAARLLGSKGAHVILMARRQPELEQVAADIRESGGQADIFPVDLADSEAVNRCAEHIIEEIGVPDVLINNAGAGRWLHIDETPDHEALHMIEIPYLAAFYVTKAFMPAMLERKRGHIINLNSPASIVVWPGATGYVAARWAMRGFTEALRADLHGTGIRVTSVIPGVTTSAYFDVNPGSKERIPSIARIIPVLSPEQVAHKLVEAIERAPRQMIFPFILWVLWVFNSLAPGPVSWAVTLTGYKRPASS
jgi:uncharacterized protein